jgi:hypothetical protein
MLSLTLCDTRCRERLEDDFLYKALLDTAVQRGAHEALGGGNAPFKDDCRTTTICSPNAASIHPLTTIAVRALGGLPVRPSFSIEEPLPGYHIGLSTASLLELEAEERSIHNNSLSSREVHQELWRRPSQHGSGRGYEAGEQQKSINRITLK